MVSSYLRVLRELVVATDDGSWSRGGGGDVVGGGGGGGGGGASPRSVSTHTERDERLEERASLAQNWKCVVVFFCGVLFRRPCAILNTRARAVR